MNKFEYKVVTLSVLYSMSDDSSVFKNSDIERLNELGDEGWEVCGMLIINIP